MLHVLDNTLVEVDRIATLNYFSSLGASSEFCWADGDLDTLLAYGSPMSHLLEVVNKYVPLQNMVGCEYWSHLNTKSGWHKDTDETLFYGKGIESFPICSVVYYPQISNLVGGALVSESFKVTPVTNRLVIFAPGILHCVENFSGKRISVALNPWSHKPTGYL